MTRPPKILFAFGVHLETGGKHFSKSHREQFSKTFCTRRKSCVHPRHQSMFVNLRQLLPVREFHFSFIFGRLKSKNEWGPQLRGKHLKSCLDYDQISRHMLRDVSMAGAWPFFVDVRCAKSFLSRVFS